MAYLLHLQDLNKWGAGSETIRTESGVPRKGRLALYFPIRKADKVHVTEQPSCLLL